MANAYVDLGTYAYFTPYVGAGIGGSYVKWDKLRNTSAPAAPVTPPSNGGKGSWRFAYQLMAGASIDVTCNVKADLGYRFRHTMGGDMFATPCKAARAMTRASTATASHAGARYVFRWLRNPRCLCAAAGTAGLQVIRHRRS